MVGGEIGVKSRLIQVAESRIRNIVGERDIVGP